MLVIALKIGLIAVFVFADWRTVSCDINFQQKIAIQASFTGWPRHIFYAADAISANLHNCSNR